ncbi:hypothetical protein M407DRAFT_33839 [Tulasnella calospora MUT 4182]|uniref:Agglutinin C-terminal domain-containing protein n=1 Tax=Tulasnella calospora MUT 4182 TaxID=1051891 RepID=A0A0C3Q2B7_9AGAM|nr:hypothetical protein M407DRAFT_33839 [Tulasnella calospora MUT 4182]
MSVVLHWLLPPFCQWRQPFLYQQTGSLAFILRPPQIDALPPVAVTSPSPLQPKKGRPAHRRGDQDLYGEAKNDLKAYNWYPTDDMSSLIFFDPLTGIERSGSRRVWL